MKTIFTFLTLLVSLCFTTTLQAQINEGFENTGGIAYLQANGWSFYGASWDNTSQITQAGSIAVIPTTSTINNNHANSNTTQIVSPAVNFSEGGKITFNYKLAAALGDQQSRTFTIRLYDATNST